MKRTVVPTLGWLDTETRPPSRSIAVRTTSMPTPRPDRSVTWLAVEKPGAKMSSMASSSDMAAIAASGADVAGAGDLADPGDVDAAAVVLDLDHDCRPGAPPADGSSPSAGLPSGGPLRGVLQP